MRQGLIEQACTLALGVAGVLIFSLAGLPLPFLFGPMAACLIAALAGARLRAFGQISVGARTVLGVAVGAAVTPALIAKVPQMAASIAIVPVYIAIIALAGVPFFRKVCGFDRVTAFYSGHPQFVCHGLTELHRLKGSGRGIEEALGSNRQRGGW